MKFVISVGGSVLYDGKFNLNFAIKLKNSLIEKHKYKIVAGGGTLAKEFIDEFNFLKEDDKHRLGIYATNINAFVLSRILGFKFLDINPKRIAKVRENTVSGGYKVGWSTDVDAAIIAKYWKADILLNITNVPYVYDKDPKKFRDARPIKSISYDELIKIQKGNFNPRMHFVFDPRGLRILKRTGIPIYIFSGISNLRKILLGKKFRGTIVS